MIKGKSRVAVVGSRDYGEMGAVAIFVAMLDPTCNTVVSGGARGVDQTAEEAAATLGVECVSIPADWNQHGKSAGFIRNEKILDLVDVVVAFWDGESHGTQHTITRARARGIPVIVMRKGVDV